jgi:16S rRNA (adenine1518-N6/adenine1519-N6)-dimethyltransferase
LKTRAKKRYGQHFLHDPGTIDKIVRAIGPAPGQRIVEIGPGRGAITAPLLAAAGQLDVVEIDPDVVPPLRERCAGRGELRVHLADALEFDFTALRGGGPKLRLAGNLPYNVSTPLLFHFIAHLGAIEDMHFMLQREVVARMAAAPGNGDYGRLTVMLAPVVQVEPLFDIGTGAFSPPPKVVSTFFALRPHVRPPFDLPNPRAYARVVAAAFSKRRKTLRNSLAGVLTAESIVAAGIDPGARPETLSPAQFAALAERLPA